MWAIEFILFVLGSMLGRFGWGNCLAVNAVIIIGLTVYNGFSGLAVGFALAVGTILVGLLINK